MERISKAGTFGFSKRKPVFKAHKTGMSRSLHSPVENILNLQRTVGNRAVEGLLKSEYTRITLPFGTIHLDIPYGLYSAFCTPISTDLKGIQDFALKTAGATPPAGSFGAGFTSPRVSYSPTELDITTTKTDKGLNV